MVALPVLVSNLRIGSARARQALTLAAATVLCGCAALTPKPQPTVPAPPPAPPSANERAALPAALSIERRWLDSWFRGTPVVIAQHRDDTLTIQVPREFCFEPGRSDIKPALDAVLDKVAQSLRRRSAARVNVLAAPDDSAASAALALRRAAAVRDRLLALGVAQTQLTTPTASAKAVVQLSIGADSR